MNLNALLADLDARVFLVLASLSAGGLAYLLVGVLQHAFAPTPTRAVANYIGGSTEQRAMSAVEKWGAKTLRQLPVLQRLNLKSIRRWTALTGKPVTPAQVVGEMMLLGLLGLVVFLRSPGLLSLGFLVGMVWYPLMSAQRKAGNVRKQTLRALPDLAAVMAAEMTAGNSADTALERASEWRGPLGAIIREAAGEARRQGRTLFSISPLQPGMLLQSVRQYDLPPLWAFASQVDLAARKGVGGPELMEALARTQIIEYKNNLLREAESLDNKMMPMVVVFFFAPLMVVMAAPSVMSFLATF